VTPGDLPRRVPETTVDLHASSLARFVVCLCCQLSQVFQAAGGTAAVHSSRVHDLGNAQNCIEEASLVVEHGVMFSHRI